MELIFTWVESFSENLLLLFFSMMLLSMVHTFIPPIPLEGITVFGSYVAGTGHGSAFIIWTATTLGMSVGNFALYYLAKTQGERVISWRFIKEQIPQKYIDKARGWFQRFGLGTIFLGKLITGMSFVTVFCCGLFKMEQKKALTAIILSNIIYYGILVFLGKYFGLKWENFSDLGSIFIIASLICGGVILLIFFFSKLKKRYQRINTEDNDQT